MEIFQKSIVNKYLQSLDEIKVTSAYEKFLEFYGNKARIQNIILLKEENYQEGFLRELFVQVLGYTINPDENYNLTTEYKNLTDSKKADGAILKDGKAIGVIELKSTKTKDLDTIRQQAFNYKNNQPECKYVITSNFHFLRFYIDNATEYEEFDLFNLTENEFRKLFLILNKDNIFSDIPATLKQETQFHEEKITDKFYNDYSTFKHKIYNNLVKNNPQHDRLLLFKKSQKLLDRLLFIFFAEDAGLIPPNAISTIIDQWHQLKDLEAYQPLYDRYKLFFDHLNKGHKYKNFELPEYNGGLFADDEILNNVLIDDEVLEKDSLKLSAYDFSTEIDVNILGHIFEHSISEIEEIAAELEGKQTAKKQTRRKKEGIFYTPKYITQYIVENTIGSLCKEKKQELNIQDIGIDESFKKSDGKISKKGEKLFKTLNQYKDWLLTLKILDPACGSGAFLNQALDFLINEHKANDSLINELTNQPLGLFDTDKAIIEKNLYGVDINEESVEIAKLSLWLRTARKGRKLSMLNDNIKCGNSLIDDPEIAGEKAFNWNKQFPEIMEKGGFDVVIGNPPYVGIQDIDWDSRRYYETIFECATGRFDLYSLFIEKSMQIRKTQSGFAFIIPGKFLNNNQFSTARKILCIDSDVKIAIIDDRVFEEAHVNSVIVESHSTLGKKGTYEAYKLNKQDLKLLSKSDITSILKSDRSVFRLEITSEFNILIAKIEKDSVKVKDIGEVKDGIVAGVIKDILFLNDRIDKQSKKLYFGKHLSRYSLSDTDIWVNYKPEEMMREEVRRKGEKRPGLWMRDENIFIRDKIVYRKIGKELIATYGQNGMYYEQTIHSCHISDTSYNTKFILALFNSNLIKFYYQKTNSKGGDIFPQVRISSVENLPIKKVSKDAQYPFVEKVDQMLCLNNQLQTKKILFLNRVRSNFEFGKISKKIDKFYAFEFKTFVAELKKNKIQISLKEQDEWEDYFNNYKQKITGCKKQIDQIDKEIDQMVYELYGLTPEEIEIVEKAV